MTRLLIHSNAIADYRGVIAAPGAILLEGNEIIAAGTPQEVGDCQEVDQVNVEGLVLPAMANVHTHLDLSGVGPKPPVSQFATWVEDTVMPIRRVSDLEAVRCATAKGIGLAIDGGTAMVGDIAGTLETATQVSDSQLLGVAFLELFGLGNHQADAAASIRELPSGIGVQPHAPYSCGTELYLAAITSGRPLATHLAETHDEFEATTQGTGTLVDLAKRLGAWDESVQLWDGHPVDVLLAMLGDTPMVAAHLNYIEERHLALLAESQVTVAYCPRSSTYFGHENHRVQEMLASGVSVALGTDSLICLDTPDRISVLDEMRVLYRSGGFDSASLIAMATINGAEALGEDQSTLTLETGSVAGLIAIETTRENPFSSAMNTCNSPTWIVPLGA